MGQSDCFDELAGYGDRARRRIIEWPGLVNTVGATWNFLGMSQVPYHRESDLGVKPLTSLAHGFVLGAGLTLLAVICISGLYLAKSAMGINLMQTHSPLHDILFPFLR